MTRKRTKRRAPGTGSIRTRPDTGRIQAAFTIGYDARGNPKRVRRDFDTTEEAELWLAQQLVAKSRGEALTSTNETVAERAEAWLAAQAVKGLAERTLADYQHQVRTLIIPHLGRVPLKDLRPDRIQGFLAALHAEGATTFRINLAHKRLNAILANAVDLELIPRNPAQKVKPPKPPKRRYARWSAGEALRVIEACQSDDHPVARYMILGLTTGLRKEELLGLRWSSVDLQRRLLRVQHTVTFIEGRAVLGEAPKSDAGWRTVFLDDLAIDALSAQREHVELARAAARKWADLGLVFPSSVGTPLSDGRLREQFERLRKLAGVPRIRPYDLRSTHGSVLADAGVNPKLISERLGHTDVGFTMSVYVRTQEAEARAAAEAFARAVSGSAVATGPARGARGAPERAPDAAPEDAQSASGTVLPPDVN